MDVPKDVVSYNRSQALHPFDKNVLLYPKRLQVFLGLLVELGFIDVRNAVRWTHNLLLLGLNRLQMLGFCRILSKHGPAEPRKRITIA